MAKVEATRIAHLFMADVCALPMTGAILADRLAGKYPVILWVSLIYCVGHAVLANIGDQFSKKNGHLVSVVFQIFYFIINFGSFFSTILTPMLYKELGPEVAFGAQACWSPLACGSSRNDRSSRRTAGPWL